MSTRVTALDTLRGVAILGTLGTNIWIFTNPAGFAGFLADTGAGWAETVLRTISNGKFLGLLSIMFGVGIAIQHASAGRRGERWPGWYLWRAALLFAEGVLHYLLIFEGDVLAFYAIVSVFVALLVSRSERVIRGWMIAAGTLHLALVGLLTAGLVAGGGQLAVTGPPTPRTWLGQVAMRLEHWMVFRAEGVFVLGLSTLLFLSGVRLWRAGAFADDAGGRRVRARLIGWGLGLGVPLNFAVAFAGPEWFLVDRYLCAPLVAYGLLGAITALVHRMRAEQGPLRGALTAVGRSAMSGYILQNLIASVLCYRWGLGLAERFGHSGPWFTVAMWALVSALVLAGSAWWMRRHRRGPIETVWHGLYLLPRRRRVETRL